MSRKPLMPPVKTTGATPFERMTDFARRLLAVPKSEIPTAPPKPKKRKKRRHG